MTKEREALKALIHEMEYVLSCINAEEIPFDGDDFHEALRFGKEALDHLAQPEQEKERCVGCEACIDTACGRDECPKGWPKAAQPEQEPVAFVKGWNCGRLEVIVRSLNQRFKIDQPLYTSPPQRTWVGLTDDDAQDVIMKAMHSITGGENTFKLSANMIWVAVVKEVEAKLKEKNHG